MGRELNFDGGETTLLKALSGSSREVSGETIIEKVPDMLPMEIIDVLRGLISMGYVEADSNRGLQSEDDLREAHFSINSGYSKDIKDALNPEPTKPKSRRVRRE